MRVKVDKCSKPLRRRNDATCLYQLCFTVSFPIQQLRNAQRFHLYLCSTKGRCYNSVMLLLGIDSREQRLESELGIWEKQSYGFGKNTETWEEDRAQMANRLLVRFLFLTHNRGLYRCHPHIYLWSHMSTLAFTKLTHQITIFLLYTVHDKLLVISQQYNILHFKLILAAVAIAPPGPRSACFRSRSGPSVAGLAAVVAHSRQVCHRFGASRRPRPSVLLL